MAKRLRTRKVHLRNRDLTPEIYETKNVSGQWEGYVTLEPVITPRRRSLHQGTIEWDDAKLKAPSGWSKVPTSGTKKQTTFYIAEKGQPGDKFPLRFTYAFIIASSDIKATIGPWTVTFTISPF